MAGRILYLFLLFFPLVPAFGQVENQWTREIFITHYALLPLPNDELGIVGQNLNMAQIPTLARYSGTGDLIASWPLDSFAGAYYAAYDSLEAAVYIYGKGYGTSANTAPVRLEKIDPNGNSLWARQWAGPEGINAAGLAHEAGQTLCVYYHRDSSWNTVDWAFRIYDDAGAVSAEHSLPVPGPGWTPQVGAFAADGHILVGLALHGPNDWAYRICKADRQTGAVLWQQTFATDVFQLGFYDVHVAADGRSYWTDAGGRLICLDAAGEVVYVEPLTPTGVYYGTAIVAQADRLYVLGTWVDTTVTQLVHGLFIGRYAAATGEPDWTWEWPGNGAPRVVAVSGHFSSDSTLLVAYRENSAVFSQPPDFMLGEFRVSAASPVLEPRFEADRLAVYPNPVADGLVSVPYPGQSGWLALYDAGGRLLQRMRQENDAVLHLPSAGAYRVIWTDGRRWRTAGVVREK